MKYQSTILAIAASTILSGCISFGGGIKSPFPDVPENLMIKPEPMKTLVTDEQRKLLSLSNTDPSPVTLSMLSKIMSANYSTCNQYYLQITDLQDWITKQKEISK